MNYLSRVTWKCIEHAPQVSFDAHDFNAKSALNDEVTKVKTLAPETLISIPTGRPNTHLANEILTEIEQHSHGQANTFRTCLYRAIWQESKDIGDLSVLNALLKKANTTLPNVTQTTRDTLQQWQNEWEQGDFSRNIPALITTEGNKLLGFPSQQLLTLFVYGDSTNFNNESDAICTLQPRENILISSKDTQLLHQVSTVLKEYDIQTCTKSEDAIESCLSSVPPALIFLDAQSDGFSTCQAISEHTQNLIIPIILLADSRNDESEIKAFEMGASDFILKDVSPSVLKARTRTLLRLKRANDLLDEVAHMDSLTEIPNRREYNRVIDMEWRQSVRAHKSLSIILIDIDHFKRFNDNYGHIEGDKCLRTFAHFLQRSIRRPTDVVARYGGEEFVIILPDTDENGAIKVAQLIQKELKLLNIPHEFSTISEHLTVSQGVAGCAPSISDNPSSLIKAADRALYEAKGRGRNQIVSSESV